MFLEVKPTKLKSLQKYDFRKLGLYPSDNYCDLETFCLYAEVEAKDLYLAIEQGKLPTWGIRYYREEVDNSYRIEVNESICEFILENVCQRDFSLKIWLGI
jgi:hypothetical protein